MALITCPQCRKQFSDRAEKCPKCGASKEEIQRLIKEQEERDAAERERIRKEREAKEAEEARLLEEKRAEWWRKNKKWIITCISLLVVCFASYIIYVNRGIVVVASNKNDISIFRFRKTMHVIIPEGTKEIELDAFKDCTGLTSVTIPNSVTSIGNWAFSDCSGLTSVTIPNSVISIGWHAFDGCSGLTSVTINSNKIISKDYSYDSNISDIFGSQVKKYIIGDSVTSIGKEAFYKCSGLTSVTIGNSVTSIGVYAFRNCTDLTSITIGNSVTSIGSGAFDGCSGLTSLTIPNSVTSIGDDAFEYCSGLTSLTIPNSVTTIGYCAFYQCKFLSIRLPERFRGKRDLSDCKSVTYY